MFGLKKSLVQTTQIYLKNLYKFSTEAKSSLKQYSVTGTGASSQADVTDGGKLKIHTDGTSISPLSVFLSSLVACEQATSTYIAKQMGITITKVDYDIKGERDEVGALQLPIEQTPPVSAAFSRIYGTALVETTATQEQIKMLNQYLKLRCPVAKMVVDSGCKLDIEWKKR